MDLRIAKTKRSIKDAFLTLRVKNPIEKVKVKDICNTAAINKSTFYKYYQDVYALSDELEEETIILFINTFTGKDYLFTDPYRFITELPVVLDYHKELLTTLFRDCRTKFSDLLTKSLIGYYQPDNYTVEGELQLYYILSGTFSTMFDLKEKYSSECIATNLSNMIKKCI